MLSLTKDQITKNDCLNSRKLSSQNNDHQRSKDRSNNYSCIGKSIHQAYLKKFDTQEGEQEALDASHIKEEIGVSFQSECKFGQLSRNRVSLYKKSCYFLLPGNNYTGTEKVETVLFDGPPSMDSAESRMVLRSQICDFSKFSRNLILDLEKTELRVNENWGRSVFNAAYKARTGLSQYNETALLSPLTPEQGFRASFILSENSGKYEPTDFCDLEDQNLTKVEDSTTSSFINQSYPYMNQSYSMAAERSERKHFNFDDPFMFFVEGTTLLFFMQIVFGITHALYHRLSGNRCVSFCGYERSGIFIIALSILLYPLKIPSEKQRAIGALARKRAAGCFLGPSERRAIQNETILMKRTLYKMKYPPVIQQVEEAYSSFIADSDVLEAIEVEDLQRLDVDDEKHIDCQGEAGERADEFEVNGDREPIINEIEI